MHSPKTHLIPAAGLEIPVEQYQKLHEQRRPLAALFHAEFLLLFRAARLAGHLVEFALGHIELVNGSRSITCFVCVRRERVQFQIIF